MPDRAFDEAKALEQKPSDAATQRFNGTGKAKERIVRGLSADLTSLAMARDAAHSGAFPLVVCALGGFESAQRAAHIFSNELPPRSTVKGEVLRAYTEQLDAMLDGLARDFPDHTLVVVAPSGPVPPALPATPYAVLQELVLPDDPSADDGFLLIAGPGVVHAEKPRAAQAVDVVPTLLYAAGLPVGRDMDGVVLNGAFSEETLRANALKVVQTYEAKELVVRRTGT